MTVVLFLPMNRALQTMIALIILHMGLGPLVAPDRDTDNSCVMVCAVQMVQAFYAGRNIQTCMV